MLCQKYWKCDPWDAVTELDLSGKQYWWQALPWECDSSDTLYWKMWSMGCCHRIGFIRQTVLMTSTTLRMWLIRHTVLKNVIHGMLSQNWIYQAYSTDDKHYPENVNHQTHCTEKCDPWDAVTELDLSGKQYWWQALPWECDSSDTLYWKMWSMGCCHRIGFIRQTVLMTSTTLRMWIIRHTVLKNVIHGMLSQNWIYQANSTDDKHYPENVNHQTHCTEKCDPWDAVTELDLSGKQYWWQALPWECDSSDTPYWKMWSMGCCHRIGFIRQTVLMTSTTLRMWLIRHTVLKNVIHGMLSQNWIYQANSTDDKHYPENVTHQTHRTEKCDPWDAVTELDLSGKQYWWQALPWECESSEALYWMVVQGQLVEPAIRFSDL